MSFNTCEIFVIYDSLFIFDLMILMYIVLFDEVCFHSNVYFIRLIRNLSEGHRDFNWYIVL